MILCVGEILADMIGVKTDSGVCYERKAGGAPFNVACAAKKFGASVSFYGAVGDDIIGRYLIDFATARGLDEVHIDRSGECNTTLAFVELGKDGERSFCFYRKNTADLRMPYVPNSALKAASIVHIGSLMLSDERGAEYARELADRAHAYGKTVSFDVNYRTDIFTDAESAKRAYKSMLAIADIVKFSEDEVGVFSEKYITELLGDKLVFITLGANGSEWRRRGRKNTVPSVKVDPIDTTGAGDAFYAGLLSRLDGKNVGEMTDAELDAAVLFGNVCGALNTLGRGAIDALPDAETVERVLKTQTL